MCNFKPSGSYILKNFKGEFNVIIYLVSFLTCNKKCDYSQGFVLFFTKSNLYFTLIACLSLTSHTSGAQWPCAIRAAILDPAVLGLCQYYSVRLVLIIPGFISNIILPALYPH